jgi:hypothetical protein
MSEATEDADGKPLLSVSIMQGDRIVVEVHASPNVNEPGVVWGIVLGDIARNIAEYMEPIVGSERLHEFTSEMVGVFNAEMISPTSPLRGFD